MTAQKIDNQRVTRASRRNAAGDGVGRRFLIGRTDGGKVVTLVIETTLDPATWLVTSLEVV